MLHFREILSVTLILFAVIDILGSIPIVIDMRKRTGTVESGKATLVAGFIMILFLYLGESILRLFAVDVESFAIAGAIIIFFLGMEMVMGISIFKTDPSEAKTASIVPLAFPLIAGAGTMTTIISLRAAYEEVNILMGIIVNLIFVYLVLKASKWLERKLGHAGFNILRKVFGIILLSIAIKLFKDNIQLHR
jgi:multiple antibiotic resistance protein